MTASFLVELLKQGGFALLSGFMFWLYRKDSLEKARELKDSAAAYMAFGERTAQALTLVSEAMRQQSNILQQIDARLHDSYVCPITNITSEMLRQSSESPGRRKVDVVLEKFMERAHANRRRDDDQTAPTSTP